MPTIFEHPVSKRHLDGDRVCGQKNPTLPTDLFAGEKDWEPLLRLPESVGIFADQENAVVIVRSAVQPVF